MSSQNPESRRLRFSELPSMNGPHKTQAELDSYKVHIGDEREGEPKRVSLSSSVPPGIAGSYSAIARPLSLRQKPSVNDKSKATNSLGLGLGLGDLRLDRNYVRTSKEATNKSSTAAAYHSYLKYGKLDEMNNAEEDYKDYYDTGADNNQSWRERAGRQRVRVRGKESKPRRTKVQAFRASENQNSSMDDESISSEGFGQATTAEEKEVIAAAIKRKGQMSSP